METKKKFLPSPKGRKRTNTTSSDIIIAENTQLYKYLEKLLPAGKQGLPAIFDRMYLNETRTANITLNAVVFRVVCTSTKKILSDLGNADVLLPNAVIRDEISGNAYLCWFLKTPLEFSGRGEFGPHFVPNRRCSKVFNLMKESVAMLKDSVGKALKMTVFPVWKGVVPNPYIEDRNRVYTRVRRVGKYILYQFRHADSWFFDSKDIIRTFSQQACVLFNRHHLWAAEGWHEFWRSHAESLTSEYPEMVGSEEAKTEALREAERLGNWCEEKLSPTSGRAMASAHGFKIGKNRKIGRKARRKAGCNIQSRMNLARYMVRKEMKIGKRAAKIFDMRRKGITFRMIAARLSISVRTAYYDMSRYRECFSPDFREELLSDSWSEALAQRSFQTLTTYIRQEYIVDSTTLHVSFINGFLTWAAKLRRRTAITGTSAVA